MSFAVDSFTWARSRPVLLADGSALDLSEHRLVQFSSNDLARLLDGITALPESVPLDYDPQLPFPRTWFGVDKPHFVDDLKGQAGERIALVALVCDGRDLVLLTRTHEGKHHVGRLFAAGRLARGAAAPATRAWGLLVHALCAAADRAYGLVVHTALDGARRRKVAARVRAPVGVVPRDYHVVEIRDSTRWVGDAKRGIESVGRAWSLGHRHDVRAHWRVLVQRGPRDDMALRGRLAKRGYAISVYDGDLDDHTDELVRARGIRLRHGEFLAVLKIRVQPHTRGPVEAPLVPSCWRLRVREAALEETA